MKDLTDEEFNASALRATAFVNALDRAHGKDRDLLTILFALEAGLRRPNGNSAFDALVMLRDVICPDGKFPPAFQFETKKLGSPQDYINRMN